MLSSATLTAFCGRIKSQNGKRNENRNKYTFCEFCVIIFLLDEVVLFAILMT